MGEGHLIAINTAFNKVAELTTRQRLFAENYLASPNATQAAIKAGYSKKTAASQGERLLRNVEIRRLVEKRVEDAIVTADEVLTNLKALANGSERDGDRIKAWELLGKYLKLFTDKTEVTGKDGGPIEHHDLSGLSVDELVALKQINSKVK